MLCSNVDSVLIVQALGAGEVLLDRVARSLVLALDCDAEPVVVLTKADRCEADELERDLDRVRRLVGPDVRVIVTSSAEGLGLDEVRACVPAGSCAMILGESGAGKSTLLKILAGRLERKGGTQVMGSLVKMGYYSQHQTELLNSSGTGCLGEIRRLSDPRMTEEELIERSSGCSCLGRTTSTGR